MISADWGAQRVKGLSIYAIMKSIIQKAFLPASRRKVETSLIEQYLYPKFGPGQLWEITAQEFEAMGGKILKSCRVVSVIADGEAIRAVKYVHDGREKELALNICISSMPLKDLISGWHGGALDPSVKRIAAGLPYRDFVTVGLLIPRLKLQNQTFYKTLRDIVPDCWIYVQDDAVKLGRIQIFNNWSPYMVREPEKNIWIGLEYFCEEGDAFWNMEDEECIRFAEKELIQMGIIDEKEVLDAHRERVKKAYPAYFDTYTEIQALIDFLNGFTNLFCVGRNGQHRYNNMDHSMATSFEAVECILHKKTDKSRIWAVNTEKEYHESSAGGADTQR